MRPVFERDESFNRDPHSVGYFAEVVMKKDDFLVADDSRSRQRFAAFQLVAVEVLFELIDGFHDDHLQAEFLFFEKLGLH